MGFDSHNPEKRIVYTLKFLGNIPENLLLMKNAIQPIYLLCSRWQDFLKHPTET